MRASPDNSPIRCVMNSDTKALQYFARRISAQCFLCDNVMGDKPSAAANADRLKRAY
jgi:hypothetical protein